MGLFTKGLAYRAGMKAAEAKNHQAALENFEKAGELGHPDACYQCAVYYAQGWGTSQNLDKALTWAKRAKECRAQNAGKILEQIQTMQKNAANLKELMSRPNDELTREERYLKGMELFRTKRYPEALELFEYVCPIFGMNKGKYPDAQVAMGWIYEHGSVGREDPRSAYWHYRIAAENDNRDGMMAFVRMTANCLEARPLLPDCEAALKYAEQLGGDEIKTLMPALKQRLQDAQARESYVVARKQEEEKWKQIAKEGIAAFEAEDYVKALPLLKNAAEHGNAEAQFHYGLLYRDGNEVEMDLAKALYWVEKAAENGLAIA